MRSQSRTCLIAACLAAVCLTSAPARAQSAPGWELHWQPVHLGVKGADDHLGDETTLTSVLTVAPPQLTDRVTHEPIGFTMDGKNTFRTALTYRGRTWGFGVGGWVLRTGDSLAGRVTSPADAFTATSYTTEVHTVLLWNELLFPVRNDLEPSGFSPIDYRASSRVRSEMVDAFALTALVNSDATRLDLIVGGKFGRIRSAQDQSTTERAFVLNAFRPQHFVNDISLSSAADASVTGAGPMAGLTGQTTWRRLHLRGSLAQAVVLGSVDQSGTFSDVDAVRLALGPAGPYGDCPLALAFAGCYAVRSDWAFSKSDKTLMAVTDLQLTLLVDVVKHVAVGATSFTSVWNNVPAPPAFTMSHSDAGPGLDWEIREHALRFGAAGLVVSVGF